MKKLTTLGLSAAILASISGCSAIELADTQSHQLSANEAHSNPNWQLNQHNKLVRKSYR